MWKSVKKRGHESGAGTVRILILLGMIVVLGGLIWYAGSRIRELNRELALSEQRTEQANERLREYSRELELALERARAARQRTENARIEAEGEKVARSVAEQQVQVVSEQKKQALEKAAIAKEQSERSRQELETLKQRRNAELNRMQEALNKIAPTKRTPAGMVMMLGDEHFRFDFDKATLSPKNRELLSRIAGILLASEGYRLFVDGHTDDIGSDDYNKDLSRRRAQAVERYLVDAGLPTDVIEIKGYGKSEPLAKAKTKEARARNRRVEIGIVDTIVHYQTTVTKK